MVLAVFQQLLFFPLNFLNPILLDSEYLSNKTLAIFLQNFTLHYASHIEAVQFSLLVNLEYFFNITVSVRRFPKKIVFITVNAFDNLVQGLHMEEKHHTILTLHEI